MGEGSDSARTLRLFPLCLEACYIDPMFTHEELSEALRAITSTIGKCENVQPKLKPGSSQHTLLVRRIKALTIASVLITQALEAQNAAQD